MLSKHKHTQLIVLIDPDKYNPELVEMAKETRVACFFVGGSKLKSKKSFGKTILDIKARCGIPVIIFPGDESQISSHADGILMLSLISGRNPEYLIGKHVKAALKIKDSGLKPIPAGYILINGGKKSTTQKVTKTQALTAKKEIVATAVAGELTGKKIIYLEAGSGAKQMVNTAIITAVKQHISIPLIVGGGIDSVEKAKHILKTKPDYLVVGNALETNPDLLMSLNQLFV